ncbi:DDE_3 domain-containing protein [Trichonephila clavipes]|nr:DDE_3 domain-containing protein [Trichonephila clavipes]
MDQRAIILLTDESGFGLTSYSRCTFIWRELGTNYLLSNVGKIDLCGSGGLMVSTDIPLDGCSQLHILKRRNVTTVRYRDQALEPFSGVQFTLILF